MSLNYHTLTHTHTQLLRKVKNFYNQSHPKELHHCKIVLEVPSSTLYEPYKVLVVTPVTLTSHYSLCSQYPLLNRIGLVLHLVTVSKFLVHPDIKLSSGPVPQFSLRSSDQSSKNKIPLQPSPNLVP